MAIQNFKKQDSAGLAVGMGFLTGGPAGAASALLAKKNPGLGAIGSLIGGGKAAATTPTAPDVQPTEALAPQEQINAQTDYNPIEKKVELMQQDPNVLTHQALELYKDPQIYAQNDGENIVPQLLRFKHYGSKA